MIIHCEQRSQEWFEVRAGKVTASEMADVMAFTWKGSKARGDKRLVESDKRANYRAALVAETLTGEPDMDGFLSRAMEWGEMQEAAALLAYELRHGVMVERIGFGVHDRISRLGASPDALVGDDGGVETKALKSKNHLDILKTGEIPGKFMPQIYTNLAVFEREWWDFCSFDSRFKGQPGLQLWTKRVYRDEELIKAVEDGAAQMLEEVDQDIAWLQAKYGPFEVGSIGSQKPNAEYRTSADGWLTDEDFEAAIRGEI